MQLFRFKLIIIVLLYVSSMVTFANERINEVETFAKTLNSTNNEEIAYRILYPYILLGEKNLFPTFFETFPVLRSYKWEVLNPATEYDSMIDWIKIGLINGDIDLNSLEDGSFETNVKLIKYPNKKMKCLKQISSDEIVGRFNAFLNCDYAFFGHLFGTKVYPFLGMDFDISNYINYDKIKPDNRSPGFQLDLH